MRVHAMIIFQITEEQLLIYLYMIFLPDRQ